MRKRATENFMSANMSRMLSYWETKKKHLDVLFYNLDPKRFSSEQRLYDRTEWLTAERTKTGCKYNQQVTQIIRLWALDDYFSVLHFLLS